MLTFSVFGGASLESPDGPITGRAVQRRPLALLALLVADPARAISRDRLLLLLAPESDMERARQSLRDSLYALRTVLGADAIVSAGEELRIDRGALDCDVWKFEAALEAGDLPTAVALRTGPFLDGFHLKDSAEFDSWAAAIRDRLDARYVEAIEALARAADAASDFASAVRWWSTRLAHDPTNARATIALMHAQVRAGDIAGALRRAATHAALLKADFDAPPDQSIEAFVAKLRAKQSTSTIDRAPVPAAVPVPYAEPASTSAPRPAFNRIQILTGVIAIAVLLGAGWVWSSRPSGVASPIELQRVAIAPFMNATGDSTLNPIGSMAADWITQGLATAAIVEVVPLATVLGSARWRGARSDRYNDDSAPVQSVMTGTGATIVVYGSYYKAGDQLVFQTHIASASRGTVLHSLAPVHASATAPLEGIEELRRRTLAGLAPLLDARMKSTVGATSQPPNYEAYRDLADGIERYVAGDFTGALSRFERAATEDTTYTLPLAWVAITKWNIGDHVGGDSLAKRILSSGIRLAPLDEAMVSSIQAWASGDWRTAYELANRASTHAPGSLMAIAQIATEAQRLGRPGEALQRLQSLPVETGELRGWVYYWQDLAEAHHLLGDHQRELETAREASRRYPDRAESYLIEIRALAALGRVAEIHTLLDRLQAGANARYFGTIAIEGALELMAHNRDADAMRLLQQNTEWFSKSGRSNPMPPTRIRAIAKVHLVIGNYAEVGASLRSVEPPPNGSIAVDFIGMPVLAAAQSGDSTTARIGRETLKSLSVPLSAGRKEWWLAAVLAAQNDCREAIQMLRDGLSRGIQFGMELHNAFELRAVRKCDGWTTLTRAGG